MSFSDYAGVEGIGCGLALLVLMQLAWELRRIYLSDFAGRKEVFLQVQGRRRGAKSRVTATRSESAVGGENARHGP